MRSIALSVLFSITATIALAQLPVVDIGMAPLEDGSLEVRMRPDLDFTGIFAAVVFTVRYPETSPATLTAFTPTPGGQFSGAGLSLSGGIQTSGGYSYAIFTGFGFSTVSPGWVAGEELVLGKFDVSAGGGDFRIVNDDWTAANNGNYYVSLNGEERTGIIYELSTRIDGTEYVEPMLTFTADPGSDHGLLTVERRMAGSISLDLFDSAGKVVAQWSEKAGQGLNTMTIQAPSTAIGQYRLRIQNSDVVRVVPWFIGAY